MAETSITLPRVQLVIDTLKSRQVEFCASKAMLHSEVKNISHANMMQRSGRAGRVAEGIAIRLGTSAQISALQPQPIPKIQSSDLQKVVLDILALGFPSITSFNWLHEPPKNAVNLALSQLQQLKLLDKKHQLTELGKCASQLQTSPWLATFILQCDVFKQGELACWMAAVLEGREVLKNPRAGTWQISATPINCNWWHYMPNSPKHNNKPL